MNFSHPDHYRVQGCTEEQEIQPGALVGQSSDQPQHAGTLTTDNRWEQVSNKETISSVIKMSQ